MKKVLANIIGAGCVGALSLVMYRFGYYRGSAKAYDNCTEMMDKANEVLTMVLEEMEEL